MDPSARPENAGPTWISIDAFKALELAKNPGFLAEAREKRDLIVLHLVVLYKEACVEYQATSFGLDAYMDRQFCTGRAERSDLHISR